MYTELIDKLQCNLCGGGYEIARIHTSPYFGIIEEGSLECAGCGKSLLVRDGILDCNPIADGQLEYWEKRYETQDQESLAYAIEKGLEKPELLNACYPLLRMAKEVSPPLESSLELGCGSGISSLVLKASEMVEDVTLLDYSWNSLMTARKLFSRFGVKCNLVHARLEDAPFKKIAFSLSLSSGVIEHYRKGAERLACIQAHFETGRMVFVQAPVSTPGYWLPRLLFTAVKFGWPLEYEHPVTIGEINGLIQQNGAVLIQKERRRSPGFQPFTGDSRPVKPGWCTGPLYNEISVLAENTVTGSLNGLQSNGRKMSKR